jgi:hypothetical protein
MLFFSFMYLCNKRPHAASDLLIPNVEDIPCPYHETLPFRTMLPIIETHECSNTSGCHCCFVNPGFSGVNCDSLHLNELYINGLYLNGLYLNGLYLNGLCSE